MPRKKKTAETLSTITPLPPGPPVSVLSVPRPGEAHESEKAVPPPSPVELRKPVLVPVADLLPHPRNYREYPQIQIDHGMRLTQVKPEIKSEALRGILREQKARRT